MSGKMWRLTIFIIFKLLNIIFCQKQQIPIGLILIKTANESDLEIAFRAAVARINSELFDVFPMVRYAKDDNSLSIEHSACNLISKGVLAIFGPTSAKSSGIVSSICNEFQIPHILFTWREEESNLEKEQRSMTLNVYPENRILARGLADVVNNFGWRGFTVIFETDDSLNNLQDILQLTVTDEYHVTVRRVPQNEEDLGPFMKKIKNSGETCFVVECSLNRTLEIFRMASELNMMGEYWFYYLSNIDIHTIDLKEIKQTSANITALRIVRPENFAFDLAHLDWRRDQERIGKQFNTSKYHVQTEMVMLHDAVKLFGATLLKLVNRSTELPAVSCSSSNKWLPGRNFVLTMQAVNASEEDGYITGNIAFNQYGERTEFKADIIDLRPNGFEAIASYDTVRKVSFMSVEDPSKKLEEKIQTKVFRVVSRYGPPFLMWRNETEDEVYEGNKRFKGYVIDLMNHLTTKLNTKYVIELVPDGQYGKYDPITKKWNGIVKHLIDGKADLGICDLTITYDRRKAVDFTAPFMTLGISILYRKPHKEPPELFSFLSPFSMEVWLYMATAYLVVSFLLFILSRLSPDDWENPHPCNENPEEYENTWYISNTTWLTMGSIMGQGCDILPKAISTRLVTAMWWFFALMMLNSYTANLAAFLTMSRMEISIESAEDLAKQNKIKYGALKDGSTMQFFKESNFSTYQKMWAVMENTKPTVFTKSNEEGKERVLKEKGNFAFLMESTMLNYITERECSLRQVGGWLDVKYYGIALPLNSPYRKMFTEAILQLSEQSQLRNLKRKWWEEKREGKVCTEESQKEDDNPDLGLENVGGVFLVLGSGILVAFIIAMFEFLWNIQKVAVEQQITPWEAFQIEGLFALKFWIRRKNIQNSIREFSASRRSSKSGYQNSLYSVKSDKKINQI